MTDEVLKEKIINCLCGEYQSVWIIDTKTRVMTLFRADVENSIPGSIEIVSAFHSYTSAYEWYLEHCVVPQDRERVSEQAKFEVVCEKLRENSNYFIEYSRISGIDINYNQLCYFGIFSDDGNMDYYILGFRDIDVRKRAERDDLTGLYTRQFFFQKAEQLLRDYPDEQFDIMISDIVDFKDINETYGADIGDKILKWSGAYIAPMIRDRILIGRYGGDQYAILACHEDMQVINSLEHANDYLKKKKENGLPDHTVKFGIYENVPHNKSIISICDKAHIALNSIKHQYGKFTAYYDDELKKELEVHRKIENSMHQALADEQFKVYYQPKHEAATGKLIGAEALVRWIHPEYGFMSPGDFIPLFEHNGFVVETDYYVWRRTCANLRRWQDKGIRTVPVSVNASRLTFRQENLLMKLQSFVNEYNIMPSQLHIEITETMMTEDVDALVRKLTAIRAIGYQIELDDFGSGYSSLNILSTLPIDVVKLDMSFMKQFGDAKRAKVLAACIKLAADLGYKTISEGVELKEQCDMLSILGVDAIQGYYYSKPLPEDEFEEYMKKYQ